MTILEFEKLKVGDIIAENFSMMDGEEKFKVTNVNTDTGKVSYCKLNNPDDNSINHFEWLSICYETRVSLQDLEKKKQILAMFKEFHKDCSQCPFKNECDATYAQTRKYSTDAINLCSALYMSEEHY